MKKILISIVVIIVFVAALLIYIFAGSGNESSPASVKTVSGRKKSVLSGSGEKTGRIKQAGKRRISKEPEFADSDTGTEEGAKEIIFNSADEPHKAEAPEIRLDENDNPIVDIEGNPLPANEKR